MKIKAVFSDLDGTLLIDNFKTSQENIDAITAALNSGIDFVPTTGRAISDVPQQLKSVEKIRNFILTNGATVFDRQENIILYKNYISCKDALELMSTEGASKCCVMAFLDGQVHYQKDWEKRLNGSPVCPDVAEFLMYGCKEVENLYEYVKNRNKSVEKITLFFTDLDNRIDVINNTLLLEEFELSYTLELNLEITNKGVNKANGIKEFCKIKGYSMDEIAVIGDSGNDIEMLSLTKNSYAVENAVEKAKLAANYSAPRNTESGVSWVINKILKENTLA